jgi:hypothetical protein
LLLPSKILVDRKEEEVKGNEEGIKYQKEREKIEK